MPRHVNSSRRFTVAPTGYYTSRMAVSRRAVPKDWPAAASERSPDSARARVSLRAAHWWSLGNIGVANLPRPCGTSNRLLRRPPQPVGLARRRGARRDDADAGEPRHMSAATTTWGDRDYIEPAADALALPGAPHGVFAILGNHDDDHAMPAALTKRNIQSSRTRGPAGDQRRRPRTGRRPLLDQTSKRHRGHRPRRHGALILLAHDLDGPKRRARYPPCCPAIRTGTGRPARARCDRRAEIPVVAGVGREHRTTMFVSRARHGLRPRESTVHLKRC